MNLHISFLCLNKELKELILINLFLSNPYGAPFNVNSNTCVLFPLCYYSNIEQIADHSLCSYCCYCTVQSRESRIVFTISVVQSKEVSIRACCMEQTNCA